MLSDVQSNSVKTDSKNRLCQEIYYLSGYILETLLSYALCSSLNITGDIFESKPFKEDSKQFKTHNLMQKYNYALKHGCMGLRGLQFFQKEHQNAEIQELFNSWEVKYRYETHANISIDNLSVYLKTIEDIYRTILLKYTR